MSFSNKDKALLLNGIIAVNPPVGSVYNYPEVPPTITLNIPDTGYPPEPQIPNPEPYLSEPIPKLQPDIVGYPT